MAENQEEKSAGHVRHTCKANKKKDAQCSHLANLAHNQEKSTVLSKLPNTVTSANIYTDWPAGRI